MSDSMTAKPTAYLATGRSLLAILGLHLLFSVLYHITLWFGMQESIRAEKSFFSWNRYVDAAGLQFLVMCVAFSLIWLVHFRWLRQLKTGYRLSVHLLTLPIFIFFAKDLFYLLSDLLGDAHLEAAGQIWDVFIPAMFYLVLFGFFHALDYYHRSRARMVAEAEWQANALKNELKAIKAQLNPHFLYNVFNTINASIPKEQEATREMIADLADLLRYQLKASEVDSINLEEEVSAIKKYLGLEKMRFRDRLQIHYQIDQAALKRKIPPMLIQPLVENAIKHGISHETKGGSLHLSIQLREDGTLEVQVSDDGKGIEDLEAAMSQGFGLRHTKERLEKFYQSEIKIESQSPQGLCVSFVL